MTMRESLKELVSFFRQAGRVEPGRRTLALLALGMLAERVDRGGDWQRLRNQAANPRGEASLAEGLFNLAKTVEDEFRSLTGVFTDALLVDTTHAGAALPALVLVAARTLERHAKEWESWPELFDGAVAELGQGSPAGGVGTPQRLARFMIELLHLEPGVSVLDPSCGLGATLSEAVQTERSCRVTGIDLDPLAAALARLRLHFLGAPSEIDVADALTDAGFDSTQRKFDRSICDPPFSAQLPRHVRKEFSDRYGLGKAALRSEILFLLRCGEAIGPGGRSAVLMPIGFLFRASDAELRRKLLERRQLEGIVSLPTGVVPWTELAFAIVVLRHPGEGMDDVRLVNGEGLGVRTRRGSERLTSEHVAWLVSQYRDRAAEKPDAASISVSDLSQGDVNLRPSVWLRQPEAEDSDLWSIYQTAREAEREAAELAEQIDGLSLLSRLEPRKTSD